MKDRFRTSMLALAFAAGMAGAAQAQQGVSDTEVVIGSNGDLSGVFAAFNVGAIKAAQQVFDKVNADGGVHGRKIRFIAEDHGYQVPKAVQNFNKLINADKVFAMILNLGTPHNIAGFPLMQARQVANVSPLTAARQMLEGDITYKYSGLGTYYGEMKEGIRMLAKEKGATKICSMYIPSDFGIEVNEAAKDVAKEIGAEYVDETTHRPDEQDFVGSIQKLRASGCQIIAMGIAVRPTIVAVGTAKKLGWNEAAFIGSSAGFNTAIAKVPGGVTEGYYAAAGWSDLEARVAGNEELRKWAEGYKAAFNEDPGTASQLGYAAATTLVKAFEAAGKDLTPESFKKGMEGLSFHDPILDVDVKYGPDDHQGGGLIVLSQIQGGVWKEVARVDPEKSN